MRPTLALKEAPRFYRWRYCGRLRRSTAEGEKHCGASLNRLGTRSGETKIADKVLKRRVREGFWWGAPARRLIGFENKEMLQLCRSPIPDPPWRLPRSG